MALVTARVRSSTPSLAKACCRWVLTVASPTKGRSPIAAAAQQPWATRPQHLGLTGLSGVG